MFAVLDTPRCPKKPTRIETWVKTPLRNLFRQHRQESSLPNDNAPANILQKMLQITRSVIAIDDLTLHFSLNRVPRHHKVSFCHADRVDGVWFDAAQPNITHDVAGLSS